MTVENYLNEISPVVSPHTSPNGSSSGSKRRSGDRLQRPNSGSNDRRSIGSFEPRKLASSSITTTWVKTLNELCQICPPPTVGSGGGGGRVYGVLQANFDTTPVHGGGQAFRVELKLWRPIMPSPQDPDADSEELVEKVYQNDGPFPSKKHAREAIAKLAVEWLEDEIDTRKVKLGKTKGTKLASDRGGRLAGGNAVPGMDGWGVIITEGDGKNWVGMLNGGYTLLMSQQEARLSEYLNKLLTMSMYQITFSRNASPFLTTLNTLLMEIPSLVKHA